MKVQRQAESKGKSIGLWTIATIGAVLFVFAGTLKFLGLMDEQFAEWGYSEGFALIVGVLEIVGGIGLLIKRASGWAAMGLMVIMVGAIVTHIVNGEYLAVIVPALVLAMLAVFVYGRGLGWRRAEPPSAPGQPASSKI